MELKFFMIACLLCSVKSLFTWPEWTSYFKFYFKILDQYLTLFHYYNMIKTQKWLPINSKIPNNSNIYNLDWFKSQISMIYKYKKEFLIK